MRALNPGFIARHRCRVSYGFDQHEEYCPVLHGTDAVTHAEEVESWQTVDTIAWILKRVGHLSVFGLGKTNIGDLGYANSRRAEIHPRTIPNSAGRT